MGLFGGLPNMKICAICESEAGKPKVAVDCPYCGASGILNSVERCDYYGGAMS